MTRARPVKRSPRTLEPAVLGRVRGGTDTELTTESGGEPPRAQKLLGYVYATGNG